MQRQQMDSSLITNSDESLAASWSARGYRGSGTHTEPFAVKTVKYKTSLISPAGPYSF